MQDKTAKPRSRKLLNQFKNFALHGNKFQGLPGSYDDLVMAWLICLEMMKVATLQAHRQQNELPATVQGIPVREVEDDDEDYSERLIRRVKAKERTPDYDSGMGRYMS